MVKVGEVRLGFRRGGGEGEGEEMRWIRWRENCLESGTKKGNRGRRMSVERVEQY